MTNYILFLIAFTVTGSVYGLNLAQQRECELALAHFDGPKNYQCKFHETALGFTLPMEVIEEVFPMPSDDRSTLASDAKPVDVEARDFFAWRR